MNGPLPAFGVCGWSGSGKTTLLVELVRRFAARGLRIAVVKHDVHGIVADRESKDSDRFFRTGADVTVVGPGEGMHRGHVSDVGWLPATVNRLDAEYDLVLLEGNKTAHLARKVWLQREATESWPAGVPGVERVLAPDDDRVAIVSALIDHWLRQRMQATPLCAGVLFGGRSGRMGQPRHLPRVHGMTWLEHIVATVRPFAEQVVLLGEGELPTGLRRLPVLPDVADRRGPIAGMLAAMRWRPGASWLFSACDLPHISSSAIDWLTGRRTPGTWAIMPSLGRTRTVEPLLAVYEFRARLLLERSVAPVDMARWPGVITPEPPDGIAEAWSKINTRRPCPASTFDGARPRRRRRDSAKLSRSGLP